MVFPWLRKKHPHPSGGGAANIYGFHQARVFTNGGQQYTFDFHKQLPLVSPIGPATAVISPLRSQQWPQVINPLSISTVGLGGLQAGSLATQPLSNADFSPVE